MASKIRSKDITIGSLFKNTYFKLLKSQREYKWDQEQILIFLNDLMESFFKYKDSKLMNDDESYETLIGCFYTIENTCDKYNNINVLSIIDGQQRILSLLILIKFLIEKCLSHIKEKYKDLYFEKIRKSDERSNLENDLYDEIFSKDNNYDSLLISDDYKDFRIIKNMKIISDYFINNKNNKYDVLDKDNFKIFLEFVMDIKCINVRINDSKLAFDTFIKLNARGIELTDLELLHSYIWTLEGTKIKIAHKDIEDFSTNYNVVNDLFEKNKPFKSRTNYFNEAFYSAFHCFAKDINTEYDKKCLFKNISKAIQEKPQKVLFEINENWFDYCKQYHDMIVNVKNPYNKLHQILNKIKRTEYIPILALDLFLCSNLNEKCNLHFMRFCKIVSIASYISHTYYNEKNDTTSKFDSNGLLFDNVVEFLESNCERTELIKGVIKLFPDDDLYNQKQKVIEILDDKLGKIISKQEIQEIYDDIKKMRNEIIN